MLNSLVRDTISSIRFLSRLPIPAKSANDEPLNFEKTAHTFPLAGLVIALPAAAVLWIAALVGLQSVASAILAILILTLTTGALHEDGLADTADGFWGGQTPKRRLEIMRDSAIGTYGILALIFSIALRITLLANLIEVLSGFQSALLLLAIVSISRFAMLQPWLTLPAARTAVSTSRKNKKDDAGLSARYSGPDFQTFFRAGILLLPACLIILFIYGVWGFIVALVVLQLLVFGMSRLSQTYVGGHTGDTLGATQQISEAGLLLALVFVM